MQELQQTQIPVSMTSTSTSTPTTAAKCKRRRRGSSVEETTRTRTRTTVMEPEDMPRQLQLQPRISPALRPRFTIPRGVVKLLATAALVQPVAARSGPLIFPEKWTDLQLDIVGLLAVVGEAAMTDQVQPITASISCLFPRLLPAPQSFLRTSRPWRLPPRDSVVVAVSSGNYSATLNFFPEILHGIDELPRFTVRTISLKRHENPRHPHGDRGVYLRPWGPNNLLAILGTIAAIGLITASAITKDGMSLIAIILLSATSSLAGLANYWTVNLQRRTSSRLVPRGDVVVAGRQAAFIIVKCDEGLARELYFGQERCEYVVGELGFQYLAGASMFLFMAAVIFLASGTWEMQAAIGLSYVVLNGLYWLVAALIPGRLQWDLRAYQMEEESRVEMPNYTRVIWEMIKKTQTTRWVRRAKLLPDTESWDGWLKEAEENMQNSGWDPEEALTKRLKESLKESLKEETTSTETAMWV